MGKLIIDLSNPDNYIVDANNEAPSSFSNSMKLPLPVIFAASSLNTFKTNQVVIGEVKILNAAVSLKGNIITTEIIEKDEEENPFLEGYYKKVQVTIDQEAVGALPADAKILFSMRSDLFKEESMMELMNETGRETDNPAEVICSQFVSIEEEDNEPEEFEYFILPESRKEDAVYPESIDEEGGERWHFIYDEESIPVDEESKNKKKPKNFIFRIFRLNSLRKEAEKIYNHFKNDPKYVGWSEDDLLDETIRELKKDKKVAAEIEKSYAINIYRPTTKKEVPFVAVDDNKNRIDPALKTLILVPGTFKKSIVRKKNSVKKKRWQGSFKYLMKKTGGYDNWFEFLLDNSDFEQIITLEHNSVFDNMQDNMQFFIEHLNITNIRFEQPTTVISASRGGFLAKMMARVGGGHDDLISRDELNLNIERIITVANGFSGYLESSKKEEIKKKLELIFNLVNMISFGGLTPFAGLLSFTPSFILRLPGLRGQAKDSKEIARLNSKKLDRLWCLPLANNADMKVLFFIEKAFVDPLLGPENDFVVSFESQLEVTPGQLMPGFGPVVGKHTHGKGLSEEQTRIDLLAFLNKPDMPHSPNAPDIVTVPS